jgi:uncharacterized cupin superfamily protein
METLTGRTDEVAVSPLPYPGPEFEGRAERQLGKRVGITQFGVNHLTLEPGSATSRRHWHEGEDEFVYVLWGEVVLHDENGERPLGTGEFAGFPVGAANGHRLVNRSDAPAELLVVGTRKVGEEKIHYPDEADPGPFSVVRDARGERVTR